MSLRIALLTGPLAVDDAGMLALGLAPALIARGHEVTVYGSSGPMEPRLREQSIPVAMATGPGRFLLPGPREWFREIETADLIHVVDPGQARRGGRLAFRTGRPWVLSVTSVVPSAILDAIHRPAAVLVSCRSARDEFLLSRPAARERVHIVPLGADPARFPKNGPPLAGEVPVIGALTAFDAWSGIPDLLEALRDLLSRGRKLNAILAGYGPRAEVIRRLARESGLGSRVTVTSLPRDYETLYGTMDVFVSPRHRDWFGLPILQAQAAGRPVIATGVGASFAVVREGENGCLVPAGHPSALADEIDRLIANPSEAVRLGRNARKIVMEECTAAGAAERTEAVYREVLSDAG